MYIHKCTKKFELRVKLISADANYSFDFGQRLMGSIFCSGLTDNSYEIIQLVVMRREKFTSIFRETNHLSKLMFFISSNQLEEVGRVEERWPNMNVYVGVLPQTLITQNFLRQKMARNFAQIRYPIKS